MLPWLPEGQSLESILQKPVFMGSGFATARRPGMAILGKMIC